MLATLIMLVSTVVDPNDDTLAPWASNQHPTDVPRQVIHDVTTTGARAMS